MNAVTDIVKELEEMGSPLAVMPRVTPFYVPDDYFPSFAGTIQRIAAEQDVLPGLPKTTPYHLPENYFDTFAAGILDKVAVPDFGKATPPAFEVPAGYFDDFAAKMLAAAKAADVTTTVAAPPAAERRNRTISLRPRKVLRWAAAAVVVLGVGFGSYRMMDGRSAVTDPALTARQQLAMLDKGTINSYVQQHIEEFDLELLADRTSLEAVKSQKTIRHLNKNDIQQYLDETGDSGFN